MRDPLQRLYQTKLALLAVIFVVLGIALLAVAHWPGLLPESLRGLPLTDLGSALFTTGLVVIAFEYVDGTDSDARTEARLRAILKSEAPAMRDAVIRGFAVNDEDLRRVATPQLLDQIAENSLALRFGDRAFAKEVYGDIRSQAIKAAERWYDARVQIDLSVPKSGQSAATPVFDVVVRWEYRVTPRHRFRRFAVVSDRRRYDELAAQSGETSVWFKSPTPGLSVTDSETFSLAQFTVDGVACPIERQVDAVSQVYVVDLGADTVQDDQRVIIAFTYTTRTAQAGHVLRFDIDRPTRGIDVELEYADCGIARMRLFDYVSTGQKARVPDAPTTAHHQALRFSYDGWLFPRSGLLFTWTLDSEVEPATAATASDDNARHAKAA